MNYDAYGGGGYGDTGGGYNNGGGGFVQESSQQSQSPSRDNNVKVNSITPATVVMLQRAEETPEGGFLVDNRPISKVRILGRIMSFEQKNTSMDIAIEDGTGCFSVQKWMDETTTNMSDLYSVGMYVVATGQIRTFSGKRSLNLFQLRQVTDFNQISQHFLDVILTHLQVTVGSANAEIRKAAGEAQQGSFTNTPGITNRLINPIGQPVEMDVGESLDISDPIEQLVYKCYADPRVENLDDGLEVSQCFQLIQQQNPKATLADVEKAVKQLCDNCHLYSTVDDSHYKFTGDLGC